MKRVTFLLSCLFLFGQISFGCSMYKITKEGKTIVGNNEDWFSPNSQIWFIPKQEKQYGVMHVGFINGFPQGGLNEAGMMFDGFAMSYLAVKDTIGKAKTPLDEAITHAMQSFSRVKEVRAYLLTINLSELASGMMVFVDRKGDYLIAEGDELILGKEAEQLFSNFYPSQEVLPQVAIPFLQNGLAFINASQAERSFAYCASVMNNMKQDITQYSTIYDLEDLTVRVYFFQDYIHYKELSLMEELRKGKHTLSIPEWFPDNAAGHQYYSTYNDVDDPTRYLKNMFEENFGYLSRNRLEEAKEQFAQYLNIIGYEWLNDKKHVDGAIAIFKYGTALVPGNANLYDSLGEAYLRAEHHQEAIRCYQQSLQLNPENQNAIKMLEKLGQ